MRTIHIHRQLILLLCIISVVSSCNLDRLPKGSLAKEEGLETVTQVKFWSVGLYASFRARQYGSFATAADRQADQLNAVSSFGNRGGTLHEWKTLYSDDYTIRDIYFSYYSGLKNPNYLIEQLPVLKEGLQEEKDKQIVDRVLGEAHFVRAFYTYELQKRYGMRYKASTADKDLGIPLVLKFDVEAKPLRSTNKEVFEQIFKDIAEAKRLLSGVKAVPMSDVFNANCVTALKARVCLTMKDYKGALSAAQELIGSGTYPLVEPKAESFVNMWLHDWSSEEILQMSIRKPEELPNTIGGYIGARNSDDKQSPDWLPSQWMLDLYDKEKDLRFPMYFDIAKEMEFGAINIKNKLYYIRKFYGNPKYAEITDHSHWGIVPTARQAPKVFRIAEMYLIAAEAATQTGGNALKYLNPLRVSRGLAPLSGLAGEALMQAVKDERTRELAFEGFRLWDLRRWNMPMRRHDPQKVGNEEFLFIGTVNCPELNIPASHPKFVWGIPIHDIKVNPKLKQNPGW